MRKNTHAPRRLNPTGHHVHKTRTQTHRYLCTETHMRARTDAQSKTQTNPGTHATRLYTMGTKHNTQTQPADSCAPNTWAHATDRKSFAQHATQHKHETWHMQPDRTPVVQISTTHTLHVQMSLEVKHVTNSRCFALLESSLFTFITYGVLFIVYCVLCIG